jgi:hypothetical protein
MIVQTGPLELTTKRMLHSLNTNEIGNLQLKNIELNQTHILQ